jgi:hypothetical protein
VTAFVDFVNNNAVWFYVIGIVGILYGLKMLFDARRQSRTTIFSLEQEQAGEQSYRAVFVMFGFALFIGAAWGVNAFIAPNVPQQGSSVIRTPTTIPKVLILPTFTPIPSPTKEVPTPTRTVPPTRPPVTEPPVAPTVPGVVRPSTPTPAPALPAPELIDPTDREIFIGENKANNAITFRWSWCENCFNANTDTYIVTVSYVDRTSNQPKRLTGQTRENILRLYDIIRGTGVDLYQTAVDDLYTWNIYVLRNGAQTSPRSQTFSFYWR